MVQKSDRVTLIGFPFDFINDWAGHLFVRFAVVVNLHEKDVILLDEVILIVPPFRVILVEFVIPLGHDRANEGHFA